MKKKAVSILLTCAMAFTMALGGGAAVCAEEEDITLVAAWWGSQNRNDKFTEAFDTYTANNPNVTFELQINSFGDHITALSASAASNTMPDLAMLQTAYLKTYTDADKLLDLTPYIESGALDLTNVDENVIATGKVDDGIYGISAGNNAASIIYNKTLLDENGIAVKNLMNVDEFIEVCREVYEKTGVRTQIDNISTWLEFASRANGTGLFEGNALGAASSDIFLPFFEMVETGREEGWLMDQGIVTANGGAVEEQAVVKYTSAETQSWCSGFNSNQMVAMQAAAPEGVELDLITVPCADPSASYYVRQAMCWTIAAESEHIDEAIAVLNWWINSEEANDIILGEPGVPANNEIASYVAGKLDETTAKTFNYVTDVVIPNSSAGDPPAEAGASQVLDLANEVFEKVAYGEAAAQEAADEFFTQGNSIMENAAS
ncbi:MAG: extracellular solute-binding protein [Candidatus Limivivens sp.]|nr:extracellular solute-binding protein [Candidatus Limivivens sp.]